MQNVDDKPKSHIMLKKGAKMLVISDAPRITKSPKSLVKDENEFLI